MFCIDDIDRSPSRAGIMLGGRAVEVRALSAAEIDAVKRVFLRPGPMMTANPIIGAEPRMIPNDWAPEYHQAVEVWLNKVQTAVVAISVGITAPVGCAQRVYSPTLPDGELALYLNGVVPPMRARLTQPEIQEAYATVEQLSDPLAGADGTSRIEAARKNLSGPPALPFEPLAAMMAGLGFSLIATASPPATSDSASANG